MPSASLLTKKLQIKPGHKVLIVNSPANYSDLLEPLPEKAELSLRAAGSYDVVLLFIKNSRELNRDLEWLQAHLRSDTVLWTIYPKKSSGIESDLEMMSSWDEFKKYNYRGVAAASIDQTWTALRFRPIDQVKKSEARNEAISQNEFGKYIDVANRVVTPPDAFKAAMEREPDALAFFQTLSFTNKKEYVSWLISAKQEKTRIDRLEKSVQKLLERKKNPTAK
jgi:hypothetical protein